MKKIIINADAFEGKLPEVKTYYDRILDALRDCDDGLTNHEICKKLNVKHRRRVSEQISVMKDRGIVLQKLCRCKHAPIYYLYK